MEHRRILSAAGAFAAAGGASRMYPTFSRGAAYAGLAVAGNNSLSAGLEAVREWGNLT